MSSAFANEAPPAGGHEGGGEKKAEGDKKTEGGASKSKKYKSTEDTYIMVLMRVQALEAKVKSAEAEIKHLIEEKEHEKNPEHVNEILKQIKHAHQELEKHVKDYNQERAMLMYRYPEKGREDKREYERLEVKSVEDMESAISLSNSVNKTLKKVRIQYKSDEASQSPGGEANVTNESKAQGDRLTKPIIIKK